MKKLLYNVVTFATLLFAASCQQENLEPASLDANTVSYTISVPGALGTKAIGTNVGAVTELVYEVYRTAAQSEDDYDATEQLLYKRKATITDGIAYLTLELVNKQNFRVLFWAQVPETGIYNTNNLKNVTISQALTTNMESYAAFSGSDFIKAGDILTGRIVKLHRPVAQLNIATDAESLVIGDVDGGGEVLETTNVEINNCYVTVTGLSTSYNVAEAAAGELVESAFVYNRYDENHPGLSEPTLTVKNVDYKYVAMNYLGFAPALGTNVEVTYEIDTNVGKIDNKIGNVPVKPNYRTNIVGNLITETSDYTIILDTEWPDGNRENMEVVVEGLVKNINGDYEVTSAKGLAYAISNLFEEGGNFYLTEEIYDLSGFAVTPPTVSGVTLNIYGETPVVTRAATTLAGITIIGLDNLIDIIKSDASVVITGVTIQNDKSTTVNLVNKVENGAQVLVSECFVIDRTGDASDEMSDLIGDGNENVEGDWVIDEQGNGKINFAKGLKLFAEAVNEGNKFAGKTVTLNCDVDLNNEQWASIGTSENPFSGIFDGNGKTIKNLSIVESEAKEGKAYVGFFGYAKNATIKNVTFENVNLNIACLDIAHSQGHIGAVAGSLEGTSTIENVTVKGDIKVEATLENNGASRVAVVAGGNAYGNVTMKNVHVIANEGSYLKANNNVGALAGQLQEKNVFENCSSNINVTGYKFFAGGIIGLAAGDSQFTNCHTTGDVTILAGREGRGNDHYRVGGIAGGWADGKTNVCTLINCSYEGEISGKNADGSVATDLDYEGYVGRGYTLNGCGGSKVIINGKEYVQVSDTVHGFYTVNGVYEIGNAAALVAMSDISIKGNEKVVLTADIDLTGVDFNGLSAFNSGSPNIFDGQNHTVSNWTYSGKASDMGFIKSWVGTIKNLTISNSNLKTSGRSGVIAGNVYANIDNCHVVNCSIEDSYWACGLIAGLYNSGSVSNCSAVNSSVKSNGGTGAIVGVLNESSGTRSFTNCKVEGCTVENTGVYGEGYCGALVCGMINISNSTVKFEGCEYENNNTKNGQYVGDLYYADEGNTIVVE